MPSKRVRKVHCPCPRLHNGLVDPRTRRRHFEEDGTADTPNSTATPHDSHPNIGTHPEEDIEDAWGMPGSPSDAMEVDNPTQSDQEDSFQRHEDEDEDDDDSPPVLIEEDEEREGEREDEGGDEDEEELEEEDGFVDETAPDDDVSELKRLASMKDLNPEADWVDTLRFFYYKFRSNTSDISYDELRSILQVYGVDVKSLKSTREHLRVLLGIPVRKHKLRRRCLHCGQPRFDETTDDEEESYPDFLSFATFTPRATYSYIPIIPRLKLLYANRTYSKKMRYPKWGVTDEPWLDGLSGVRDVWEGNMMKQWNEAGFFDDERTVALQFSTDGVQLFRSSTQEVWPFLVINLNLPPEESTDNFLPLGLSPGPKSPVDLDSFLTPFIDELQLLHDGVPAYDAHTNTAFLLKANLVLVSGDTPAVSKLVHLSGHVAKLPCRACKLEGSPYKIAFKFRKSGNDGQKTQYYYPLKPPNRFPADFPVAEKDVYRQCNSYDSDNLPLRSPQEYRRDGEASLRDPREATASGVKGVTPFVHLSTISIPYSCPFDVMHLVFLGFVRDLCALLNGTFFKEKDLNDHAARITKVDWEALGREMSKIEAPSSYGRDPRDIAKYIKGFKAEELSNFLIHYLLPLCFQRVSGSTYRALQHLVFAISLATSYQLQDTELDEIEHHIKQFTEWYYATFYQRQYARLPACKYTVHALLHLAREVRNWGSASYFWQYAEERLCGVLVRSVKSRVKGAANLSILMHQQQLIVFAEKFGLLSSYPKKTPPQEFQDEEEYGTQYALLPPVKARRYQLSGIQIKHLQQHYRTMYSIPSLQDPQLIGIDTSVQLWHRCRVDKTIFHCAQSRRRNASRLNHLVCLRQAVDANANFREGTRPEHMVAEDFYAYIQFYCVHHFRGRVHMLMYSSYRTVNVHDGLVEDKGHWLDGFQDISVLEHLCAKVTREDGKTFIVEAPERMEERLRKVLGA